MKPWEKQPVVLSLETAGVVIDALRYKGCHGLYNSGTRREKHPNRYDRVAELLTAEIEGVVRRETTIEVPLGPVQRYLGRRAIRWTQQFPLSVLGSLHEEGHAKDIVADEITETDAETGRKNVRWNIALREGSRPHDMVFLAREALDAMGGGKPAAPSLSEINFEQFGTDLEQAA